MDRFKITEVRAILIFLVINFITLAVIIGIQNYYFQIATDQRDQLYGLAKTIHDSDINNDNQTKTLVNSVLSGVKNLAEENRNASKITQDLILENQGIIKNTTETNLKNTFINKANIEKTLNIVNKTHDKDIELDYSIIHATEQLLKRINNTGIITK